MAQQEQISIVSIIVIALFAIFIFSSILVGYIVCT